MIEELNNLFKMTHVKYTSKFIRNSIFLNENEIEKINKIFFFGWNYFFILRIKNASESINIDILQELHAYSIAD